MQAGVCLRGRSYPCTREGTGLAEDHRGCLSGDVTFDEVLDFGLRVSRETRARESRKGVLELVCLDEGKLNALGDIIWAYKYPFQVHNERS